VQVHHLLEEWSEEVELGLFGVTHAELSGAALARWALPPTVQQAVRRHHSGDHLAAAGGTPNLAQVIACADRAANAAGHGFLGPAAINEQLMELVLGELGLSREHDKFLREFETEFEAMRLAA
jgi:HD-like signal output (HDOD) protein